MAKVLTKSVQRRMEQFAETIEADAAERGVLAPESVALTPDSVAMSAATGVAGWNANSSD